MGKVKLHRARLTSNALRIIIFFLGGLIGVGLVIKGSLLSATMTASGTAAAARQSGGNIRNKIPLQYIQLLDASGGD